MCPSALSELIPVWGPNTNVWTGFCPEAPLLQRQSEPPQVRGPARSPYHMWAGKGPCSEGNGRTKKLVCESSRVWKGQLGPPNTGKGLSATPVPALSVTRARADHDHFRCRNRKGQKEPGRTGGWSQGPGSGRAAQPSRVPAVSVVSCQDPTKPLCQGESRHFQHKKLQMLSGWKDRSQKQTLIRITT